jgi:hypothetical protein
MGAGSSFYRKGKNKKALPKSGRGFLLKVDKFVG